MTKLSEIQTDRRILSIGSSGSGKTHLIGTLCQVMPTLIVTADPNGLDTLKTMGIDTEVILVKDWKEIWGRFSEIAKAARKYPAIALDDFGTLQETAMDKIEMAPRGFSEEKAADRDKAQFTERMRQNLMLGERRLQLQQWGELNIALTNFLAEVLALPYRVKLVTALEGQAKNPRTGEDHLYPAMAGGLRTVLSAKFSLVAATFTVNHDGKTLYCLSCRSHPRLETKNRLGTGWTMIDPTMQKVLERIAGKGVETAIEAKIGTGL